MKLTMLAVVIQDGPSRRGIRTKIELKNWIELESIGTKREDLFLCMK